LKILLIQPDYQRQAQNPEQLNKHLLPSYPLILLSEILENAGHQTFVLDNLSNWMLTGKGAENDLAKGLSILLEESFDLAGISVYTPLRKESLALAGQIKEKSPSTKIVFGGPHPTRLWSSMLEAYRTELDFVLKGGAEQSLLELVNNLEGKGVARFRIPGLSWINEADQVKTNSSAIINLDLSKMPSLKFRSYFAQVGAEKIERAYIITSRGCKLWCNYCSQLWKKALFHPVERVVEEAKTLIKDFKADELVVYDDCLGMNPSHSAEIFQKIASFNNSARLIGISHFKFLDKSWLIPFQQAGGTAILLGIESGSSKLRRKMNNYIEDEAICAGIEMLRSIGLKIGIYVMIGFPSETLEDLKKTHEILRMINPEQVIATVYDLKPGDIMMEFGLKARMLKETDYLNLANRIINYMTDEELKSAVGFAEYLERKFTREVLLSDIDPAGWILGLDKETREDLIKKAESQ